MTQNLAIVRVQLSRVKGWRKPEGVVVVSRPGKWGNPFVPEPLRNGGGWRPGGRVAEERRRSEQCVEMFRNKLLHGKGEPWETMRRELPELRGKSLACWCKPGAPCHADVLIEVANG